MPRWKSVALASSENENAGGGDYVLAAIRRFQQRNAREVRKSRGGDARLVAGCHVKRVKAREVHKRRVRYARLVADRHVERVDAREVCINAASVMPAWLQPDMLSV